MNRIIAFALLVFAPLGAVSQTPSQAQGSGGRAERAIQSENNRIERAINDILGRLSTQSRTRDPFGLGMTEDIYVTPAKETTAAGQPAKPLPPQLSDVVRELKVTGLNPAKHKLFVGTREVNQGDVLKLRSKGAIFDVRVAEITPSSVIYEDLANGNKAAVRLQFIPEIAPAEPEF